MPSPASAAFSYVESDIPAGVTLAAWRTAQPQPRRAWRFRLPRLAPRLTLHPAG